MPHQSKNLIVRPDGKLCLGSRVMTCALGKGGRQTEKIEGDGVSPVGSWVLQKIYYRPDRMAAPVSALPVIALSPNDGWCDDPAHPDYNKFVTLPHTASCENLWREDHVYDVIITLDHNSNPVVPGAGSAIFFHLARENFAPTEGCAAVPLEDMLYVLGRITPGCRMEITAAN